MPKRIMRWIFGAFLLVGLGLALNTARHAAGFSTFEDSPEERAQRLAASWKLLTPGGPVRILRCSWCRVATGCTTTWTIGRISLSAAAGWR